MLYEVITLASSLAFDRIFAIFGISLACVIPLLLIYMLRRRILEPLNHLGFLMTLLASKNS